MEKGNIFIVGIIAVAVIALAANFSGISNLFAAYGEYTAYGSYQWDNSVLNYSGVFTNAFEDRTDALLLAHRYLKYSSTGGLPSAFTGWDTAPANIKSFYGNPANASASASCKLKGTVTGISTGNTYQQNSAPYDVQAYNLNYDITGASVTWIDNVYGFQCNIHRASIDGVGDDNDIIKRSYDVMNGIALSQGSTINQICYSGCTPLVKGSVEFTFPVSSTSTQTGEINCGWCGSTCEDLTGVYCTTQAPPAWHTCTKVNNQCVDTFSCPESWSCGNWSSCSTNGMQARTCNDLNSCGTSNSKPSTSQSCTVQSCQSPPTKPCASAVFVGYPSCYWNATSCSSSGNQSSSNQTGGSDSSQEILSGDVCKYTSPIAEYLGIDSNQCTIGAGAGILLLFFVIWLLRGK